MGSTSKALLDVYIAGGVLLIIFTVVGMFATKKPNIES